MRRLHRSATLARQISKTESDGSDFGTRGAPRLLDRVSGGIEQGTLIEARNCPLSAVVDVKRGVDGPREQPRPANVDTDRARGRHAVTIWTAPNAN
jgi:hypothetical protein